MKTVINDDMPMRKSSASHAGRKFTLIELLIVTAVIAILAGMLLPALNAARKKARTIACISNQKQFNIAFNFYSGDYNNWMPIGYLDATYTIGSASTTHVAPYWLLYHGKYLRVPAAASCPELFRFSEAATENPIHSTVTGTAFYSFGVFEWGAAARNSASWNNWLTQLWNAGGIKYNGTGTSTWINYSSDRNPSGRISLGDIANGNGAGMIKAYTSYYSMESNALPAAARPLPTAVHGKFVNVSYVDGHCASAGTDGLKRGGIRHYRSTEFLPMVLQ